MRAADTDGEMPFFTPLALGSDGQGGAATDPHPLLARGMVYRLFKIWSPALNLKKFSGFQIFEVLVQVQTFHILIIKICAKAQNLVK
ncbi:MAG: hypothetical protein HF978_09945 [Desulfobacteraceae bacterium]|nr:hypothetical protein [Desulfobacteraceae bacterium]MBC2755857.1 hypothetical protein [Desulfobacteraceae bacterium]